MPSNHHQLGHQICIDKNLELQSPAPLHIANKHHSKGSIWIIDTSIGLGAGKILAVLELKVNHHEINEGAPTFTTFISACGKASKKLKQTILACFAPPKVSTKARFMNIYRLIKWADLILQHSPKGRVSKDSVLAKLRTCFDQLPECKLFISRFLRDATPLLECQKILKNRGLNWETYKECKSLMETIPQRSSVHKGFIVWMEKQLIISATIGLGSIGMTICSDNIESIFGLGKQHGTGEIKDANRIALRLPAFCGELPRNAGQRVMSISVKEQQEIETQLSSLTRQRRKLLPTPGKLDEILITESDCNLSLIPRPKNDSKIHFNKAISIGCDKENCPINALDYNTYFSEAPTDSEDLAA